MSDPLADEGAGPPDQPQPADSRWRLAPIVRRYGPYAPHAAVVLLAVIAAANDRLPWYAPLLFVVGWTVQNAVLRRPEVLGSMGLLPPFAAGLVAYLWPKGDPAPGLEFYEVAAQVIPVLFLTAAIEVRALGLRRMDDLGDRNLSLLIVLLLGGG